VLRIFIALKTPSPWPGSSPQPLGPVASTLTTTPPRRLLLGSTLCKALVIVVCVNTFHQRLSLYELYVKSGFDGKVSEKTSS
jgi:hypothetical protein